MQYIISSISIFLLTSSGCTKDYFFPIGGYGCENLHQADSCHLNMILFHGSTRYEHADSLFDKACSLGLKIILAHAQRPGISDITYISGGKRFLYQAESNIFSHPLGSIIKDSAADNDTTLVACCSEPGWLQEGIWVRDQYQSSYDSATYYALFRLKINNRTPEAVCSLLIRRRENGNVIRTKIQCISGQDFPHVGVYETFPVEFKLAKGEGKSVDFAIWYMGTNDSLYCDNIVVMDRTAYQLQNGNYDNVIQTITSHYNKNPAMYRYYLWDEPNISQLWASNKVNSLLLQEPPYTIGGFQALCKKDLIDIYLDSVKTDVLLIDYYPFYGDSCKWADRLTPVDSGYKFQQRLDEMCRYLESSRNAVRKHPNTEFWFIPQAFGHAVTDSLFTWKPEWNTTRRIKNAGWWREPTSREMRCIVWLVLAYGAKGILYYRYQSHREQLIIPEYSYKDNHWVVGLTDPSSNIKRPLWHTIKEINYDLGNMGEVLARIESDTVFKTDKIPTNCFIKEVDNALLHIGTFHDDKTNYFIVVNRQCLPEETLTVTLRVAETKAISLQDCLTKEQIMPWSTAGKSFFDFKIKLMPGQGKLFKIMASS